MAAGTLVESLLNRAKDFGVGISWQKLSTQIVTSIQKPEDEDEKSRVQIATVRRQTKARNLPSQKAVVKPTPPRTAASKPKQTEKPTEVRKVFGGLFKQETIYVDDD